MIYSIFVKCWLLLVCVLIKIYFVHLAFINSSIIYCQDSVIPITMKPCCCFLAGLYYSGVDNNIMAERAFNEATRLNSSEIPSNKISSHIQYDSVDGNFLLSSLQYDPLYHLSTIVALFHTAVVQFLEIYERILCSSLRFPVVSASKQFVVHFPLINHVRVYLRVKDFTIFCFCGPNQRRLFFALCVRKLCEALVAYY